VVTFLIIILKDKIQLIKESKMRLNKIVKGFAVALPLLALAACSSNNTSSVDSEAQTNQSAQQESNVQVGAATQVMTAEEKRREKLEQLRREHIIYFEFDKSGINPDFASLLDAHAEFLAENNTVSVLLEGHADERGTPEYNIALGERRAKAVAKYFENLGVSSSQMTIVSYGEEKPANKARTEAAFAKNRRVVLVY
jgi:peptidoglycan-associated lipoprotein